jgi:hypothetical protein
MLEQLAQNLFYDRTPMVGNLFPLEMLSLFDQWYRLRRIGTKIRTPNQIRCAWRKEGDLYYRPTAMEIQMHSGF